MKDNPSACSEDCANSNNCVVGGIECDRCGSYVCAIDIDENGLCPDCSENERIGRLARGRF